MEERLGNLKPIGPDVSLRGRILDAARVEMAERESGVERIWRSRAFWYSAAAVMLLSLMLSGRRIGFAAAPVDTFEPSAEAVAAAEEISAVAGDGKATYDNLVRQFARATTEPVECAYDQQGLLEGL